MVRRIVVVNSQSYVFSPDDQPPLAGIFCGRLILPTCTLPASDVAV